MKEDKPSRSFSRWRAAAQVKCQPAVSLLFRDFEAVLHNAILFLTQMTPWSAPSPTPTLWSTPRWCPSTCRLLSLCWSTSASTSSSGWGGRGSPSARPVERCSRAQLHHLWWDHNFLCYELWHHFLYLCGCVPMQPVRAGVCASHMCQAWWIV